jgi:hypothetical protein
MSVRIAGMVLPAKVLKQGSSKDVDLSLLLVDEEKLPTNIELPRMQLCEAPPWLTNLETAEFDPKRSFRPHDLVMEAWYHPSIACMTPNRRVTWQATSDDENS